MFLCICVCGLLFYYVNSCSYLIADFSIKSFSQNTVSMLKDIGLQFLLLLFFYRIYSLCQKNGISKVLNKLQVFHFRSTVHTNTTSTPTVITHSYVLQKPPSCNDNSYKLEFKHVDQIGTSVRFRQKNVKC